MKIKKLLSLVISAAMLASTAVPVLAAEGTAAVTLGADGGKIEVESFDTNVATNENASGGKYVKIENKTAPYDIDVKFNVATAGTYRIYVNAADQFGWNNGAAGSARSGHISRLDVITGETSMESGYATLRSQTGYAGDWGAMVSEIDYCSAESYAPVHFNAGENTLKLRINGRLASTGDTNAYANIDYVRLALATADKAVPKIAEGASITMEAEEYAEFGNVKENSSASGGKFVEFISYSAETYTVKFKFYAENAGNYKIGVTGHNYYDGNNTHVAKLTVSGGGKNVIPGITATKFVDKATGTKGERTYSDAYGTAIQINLNDEFYFEKGEHEITLTYGTTGYNGNVVAGSLDCLQITHVKEKAPTVIIPELGADGGKIEVESFDTNVATNENASGGKYVKIENKTAPYDIDVKFNVATAGTYRIYVNAADQFGWNNGAAGSTRSGHISRLDVITGETSMESGYATLRSQTGYAGDWGAMVSEIDYCSAESYAPVHFNAGENTLKLRINGRLASTGDTNAYANIDYVRLALVRADNVIQTIGVNGGTVEMEDWAPEHAPITDDANASGGKLIQVQGASALDNITFKINVETAGNYKVSTVAAAQYSGAYEMSPLYFSFPNEEADRPIDSLANVTKTKTNNTILSGVFSPSKYTFNSSVYLNEGVNTITVSTAKRYSGDGIFFSLDCVSFEYADVISEKGARYEFENISGMKDYTQTATAASRGKYVAFYNEESENTEMTLYVKAENAGEYQVKLAAAVRSGIAGSEALSGGIISLNGGDDVVYITTENCIQASDVYYLDEEEKYAFAEYYVKVPVTLVHGDNEITVYGYDGEEAKATSAFDYIEFTPIKDFGAIAAKNAEVSLNVDDESTISLINDDGGDISDADVYMITYSSDNEEVASVSANGVIKGKSGGKATVTISVKENAITEPKTATVNVTVNDDRDIYFSNVSSTVKGTSYKVVINKAFDTALDVYTASYEGKKLTAVEKETITAGADGTVTINASTIVKATGEDSAVKLFVWNGMTPVLHSVIK